VRLWGCFPALQKLKLTKIVKKAIRMSNLVFNLKKPEKRNLKKIPEKSKLNTK
jgi:hypothetical protein